MHMSAVLIFCAPVVLCGPSAIPIPLEKYRNARTAHRSSVLPTFSEERLGIILYLVRRLPGGVRFLGAR